MKKLITFIATLFATLTMAFAEPRPFADGVGVIDVGSLDNGYGYITIMPFLESCEGADAYQFVNIICSSYEAAKIFETTIIKHLEDTTRNSNPYIAYAGMLMIGDRLNSKEFDLFYTLSHGEIKRENFVLAHTDKVRVNYKDGDAEPKLFTFYFKR